MKPILRSALPLAAVMAVASCNAFDLSGPKLDEDPNIQTEVRSPEQYFLGIHSSQAFFQEGNVARTVCMWLQHCAGIDRQYTSYEIYSISEDDMSPDWGFVYGGGGLQDTRKMRALAKEQANPAAEGVSQFMEALAIGTAAGVWGDIPYSDALRADGAPPVLDKQLDVYDAMQRLLDSAIVNLGAGGDGLGSGDLIYNGDYSAWIEAAWTLKARFHMATAEVRGAAAFAAALAAAQNGITSPANDFKLWHGVQPTEWNVWYQFTYWDRFGYLGASATMVDTMLARGDPRVALFNADFDDFVGDDCSSGEEWCAAYWYYAYGSPPGGFDVGASFLSGSRWGGWSEEDGDFHQPIITWAETQLIIAEASLQLGQGGALAAVNMVREASDRDPLGAITLREIAVEQWITMFQNIELWNYWRRNCEPNLTPARGTSIPGRMLYPLVERNANPNVPDPSAQPARNQNDPNGCS
jgi:hypothetical protein